MKRTALIILLALFSLLPCLGLADTLVIDTQTASYEDIVSAIELLKEARTQRLTEQFTRTHTVEAASGIVFRSTPWGTTHAEALATFGSPNTISLTWALNTHNQVYTNGIGFQNTYKTWSVAGYPVSYSNLYYVRPVVDGVMLRNDDCAMLYMAEYDMRGLGDAAAVTADITTKLAGLYGAYQIDHYGNLVWTDESGNCLTLKAAGSNLTLNYHVANAEELLHAADAALAAEKAEAEELLRIQNSSNTDGL